VYVVGHDNVRIDFYIGKMLRDFRPASIYDLTNRAQNGFIFTDFAENASPFEGADREEIYSNL
jgi:hypothetical protein